jgi:hypothetical protein
MGQLSSLAITGPPDLVQTATVTGRSFQNLHNLRELDLPAGLLQLVMRTILNALSALQSLSGWVIGWASERPRPSDADSSASLSHSPEGCVDRGGVSDRSPGGRRAAAATNTEQRRDATASAPDSSNVHAWFMRATASLTSLTIQGFGGVPFSAVASTASLPRLREVAVGDIHACRGTQAQQLARP